MRAARGAPGDPRPSTRRRYRPKPLAQLLTSMLTVDELGTRRVAAANGVPIAPRRLLELAEGRGQTASREEMVQLADLGVPLEACTEWRLLNVRHQLDPDRVGLSAAAETLEEIEVSVSEGETSQMSADSARRGRYGAGAS